MGLLVKPNVFIVGAAKCGTSALYEYLGRHPHIYMSRIKEPTFFGKDLTRVSWRDPSLDDYLDLFRGAGSYEFVGEASTVYLVSKSAASEIREFSPEARIIIMLRDPVDAMYAMYTQEVFNLNENLVSFGAALDAESDREQGRDHRAKPRFLEDLLYRRRARFSEQAESYIKAFGRNRVHFVVYDDFKDDTNQVYHQVLAFLGAEPHTLSEYPKVNASQRRRSRGLSKGVRCLRKYYRRMDPEGHFVKRLIGRKLKNGVRNLERAVNMAPYRRPALPVELDQRLRREFQPEVERLGRLLHRDLSHWSRMAGER